MSERKTVLERFEAKLSKMGGQPTTAIEAAMCEAIDEAILDAIARLVPVTSAPSVPEEERTL